MGKIGRPTDAKKDICIKLRIDEDTYNKLELCMESVNMNRSETIRHSILEMYNKIVEGK